MKRVLQKNLRLHDQIVQCLRLLCIVARALRLRCGSRRSRLWRRGSGRFRQPSGNSLQEILVRFPAQRFEPLLVPVVVGIDVHEPLQRVACLPHVSGIKVNVE